MEKIQNRLCENDEYRVNPNNLITRLVAIGAIKPNGIIHSRIQNLLSSKNPEELNDVLLVTSFLPASATWGERIHCIRNNITSRVTCKQCLTAVKYDVPTKKYRTYCSRKCSATSEVTSMRRATTSQAKYGTDNPMQCQNIIKAQHQTMLSKYGVTHANLSPLLNQKRKNTNKQKYGYESPTQHEDVKQKTKETNMVLYGHSVPMHSLGIRTARLNQHKSSTGVVWPAQVHNPQAFQLLETKDWLFEQHYTQQKSLVQIATEIGVNDTTVGRYLAQHGLRTQIHYSSSIEREVGDWLIEQGLVIEKHNRTIIKPYELDIVIESHKLAIEVCGVFWHSEQAGKDRNYHRNKLVRAEQAGYRLITLFDDTWNEHKLKCKQTLQHILHLSNQTHIYARNCTIHTIHSISDKTKFFNEFHLQGTGDGSTTYALCHENVTVAMITFKHQSNSTYILNRFATSAIVPGGFSKLVNKFRETHPTADIITYADRCWGNGDVYLKNGFLLDKVLPPDYKYVINKTRIHKFNFRHAALKKLLPRYDGRKSEVENMKHHNFPIVWDCGLLRYKLPRK